MPDRLLQFPTGAKDAIVTARDTFSFDDLHQLRHFMGDAFGQQVLGPPKRILGCLEDDEHALFALLFLTELSDYMPINPKLSDAETSDMVRTSGADIAIVSRTLLDQKCAALSMINVLIWDDIVQAAVQALRAGKPTPMPPKWNQIGRLILHTSGSTGTPKRVPISLDAMNASAQNIAKGHRLAADDHALNALPTFHIGALVDVMLAPFAAQGRISLTANRAPEDLVAALIKQRPTWFQVVPTLLRRLVEDVDHATLKQAGQSLRFIRSISAPVPQDLKDAVEALLGCPVIEMYGMTETAGQIATLGRDPQTHKPGSVGKPVGVEVAILDRFGNALGPGQTGEVCVRGPTVFEGYEGSTRDDVFFEHYFRTGDLGKRDPDGSLFLQGRLKEMINVGGEKVSPHEIET
ncbi:MAG: AMP-binding protein, partial [Paracoccaceae bacterium]